MFCRNMLQSASVCQHILSSINQPDESRCQKSLSEQVASSRSTEKLQNDVHNSIQLTHLRSYLTEKLHAGVRMLACRLWKNGLQRDTGATAGC